MQDGGMKMAKQHLRAGVCAIALTLLFATASVAQDSSMYGDASSYYGTSSVAAVQERLTDLGYEAGPIDGLMGPKTRGAIRAFQKDAGLPVTGKIDSDLVDRLNSLSAEGPPIDDPAEITRVETKLDSLGWAVGPIDGVIDEQLRIALTKYTRFAGLPVSENLTMGAAANIERNNVRSEAEIASKLLWQVETALAEKGYLVGPIDGTADPITFGAIVDYEDDNDLPRNGKINAILLDSLGIVDDRPLTAEEIGEIERRLADRGYAAGAADGVADSETESAITAYQADAGEAQTGRATFLLLSELRRNATVSESFVAEYGELYPGGLAR
jgi:peptidoglycan hydrolase-like protein with peptidoglycan-binding domain